MFKLSDSLHWARISDKLIGWGAFAGFNFGVTVGGLVFAVLAFKAIQWSWSVGDSVFGWSFNVCITVAASYLLIQVALNWFHLIRRIICVWRGQEF